MDGAARYSEQLDSSDEIEFKTLFETHFHTIQKFFYHKGFDLEDSRDLSQTTFLRAYQAFADYRHQGQALSWLLTIARNVWRNQIREMGTQKRKATVHTIDGWDDRVRDPSIEPSANSVQNPLKRLLSREQMAHVNKAVEELPRQMKNCFLLRFYQGRKYREIAELLQLDLQTVKSHLHQARKRLAKNLEEFNRPE
jgi:RNA polymerase sigma-70 factor (ECF subfamily)